MDIGKQVERILNFENMKGEGLALETFFPWDLTVKRWLGEGLPAEFAPDRLYPAPKEPAQGYFNDCMTEQVYAYEKWLGFAPMKRLIFDVPFLNGNHHVSGWEDWEALKAASRQEMDRYCTEENMKRIYGRYAEGHDAGEYSIRMRVGAGFFWLSRDLLGIEEQLYGFYDEPELIHDMNEFLLEAYLKYMTAAVEILKPEVLLFPEDLSGANGPMISPETFREFVGSYYRRLFPVLKEHGAKNIFVDTDGDFRMLIPEFLEAGVDGFLPMDVNAGMDIVAVRREYPGVKFIGAFNKLKIAEGPESIDREFDRLLPVIRQGGYLPGCDHQAAPSTSLENYRYYVKRLWEVMSQAGSDV